MLKSQSLQTLGTENQKKNAGSEMCSAWPTERDRLRGTPTFPPTAMTTPENNDLIGWMTKNNCAAHAAHTASKFLGSLKTPTHGS